MGQNILEPEPPVLGVVTKVPQSGLGEVFGRGFHSWTRKEKARLGAEGPKLLLVVISQPRLLTH